MSWLMRSRRSSGDRRRRPELPLELDDVQVQRSPTVNRRHRREQRQQQRQHQQQQQRSKLSNGMLPSGNNGTSDAMLNQPAAASVKPSSAVVNPATVLINRFGLLELDLSDRDLRSVPNSVFALGRLEVLRLARNRLGAVPADVSALRRLRLLDVGNNELEALPDALANCVRLAELDARGNRLAALPAQLPAALAPSLRALRLAGNRFDALPEDVGRLSALSALDASANRVRDLPPSFARLQQLRVLNLSDNGFDSLPDCVSRLSRLETLDVSRNRLAALPHDFPRLGRLRELRVAANRFDAVPEVVCRTLGLVVLDLSDNSLTSVPSALARLPRLVELNVQRNAVDTFPDDAVPVTVERLNVAGNRLRRLTVAALTRLRRLDADGNWLTEMPRGVYRLESLEALSVSGNRIAHLSSDITLLTRLRLLDVSDNALRSLPKSLDRMPNLTTLNVSGNDLRPPRSERHRHGGGGRRGRDASTSAVKNATVDNGPRPAFVVSADPSSRVVFTSPVLSTPNGDLLYRPPPGATAPSPAKSGSRLRSLFRRKSRDDAPARGDPASTSARRHQRYAQGGGDATAANNTVQSSSSELSNVKSRSRDSAPARRQQSADEAPPFYGLESSSSQRRRQQRSAAASLFNSRSQSVTDLPSATAAAAAAAAGHRDARDGGGGGDWPVGSLRGSRVANVGRMAAVGIDLVRDPDAAARSGRRAALDRAVSAASLLELDNNLLRDNSGNDDDDVASGGGDDDRCSDTVTVNEAVGDELSLGEDDFEFLPSNVQDTKLMNIASDLEMLLNRQLLQPIIGDNAEQRSPEKEAVAVSSYAKLEQQPASTSHHHTVLRPHSKPPPAPTSLRQHNHHQHHYHHQERLHHLQLDLHQQRHHQQRQRQRDQQQHHHHRDQQHYHHYHHHQQQQQQQQSSSPQRQRRPAAAPVQRDREDVFVVGPPGGVFQSSADPEVSIQFPPGAVNAAVTLTLQVVRLQPDLVSEARRFDRSLSDLLAVGDVVCMTASRSTASRRRHDDDDQEVVLAQPATLTISSAWRTGGQEVVLAQPATLTISSPWRTGGSGGAEPGKLSMLTYRGGRVDATTECVPCAYDCTARRRHVDIRVWQLTGIGLGGVLTTAGNAFTACRSVERLLTLLTRGSAPL